MDILDTVWHLLNFVLPALGFGVFSALLAKGMWRRRLGAVSWQRLSAWATGAALLALTAGLVVLGRDGQMATYGVTILSSAAALWWAGLRGR